MIRFSNLWFPYKCMGAAIFELRLLKKVIFLLKKWTSPSFFQLETSNLVSMYFRLPSTILVYRFLNFQLVFEIWFSKILILSKFWKFLKKGTKKLITRVLGPISKIGILGFFVITSSNFPENLRAIDWKMTD